MPEEDSPEEDNVEDERAEEDSAHKLPPIDRELAKLIDRFAIALQPLSPASRDTIIDLVERQSAVLLNLETRTIVHKGPDAKQ
jgi:hypothetical protein